MTTGEMAKAPALFLRNATGLVKGWSGFDAFAYSFMSVNLVALGMFYSLAIFGYVPDGSAVLSILITAVGMTFMALALDNTLTYGGMALGAIVGAALGLKRGGIGFVLSATGWWFILALWAPIYGFILKIEFIQPLAAVLGWK